MFAQISVRSTYQQSLISRLVHYFLTGNLRQLMDNLKWRNQTSWSLQLKRFTSTFCMYYVLQITKLWNKYQLTVFCFSLFLNMIITDHRVGLLLYFGKSYLKKKIMKRFAITYTTIHYNFIWSVRLSLVRLHHLTRADYTSCFGRINVIYLGKLSVDRINVFWCSRLWFASASFNQDNNFW